MAGITVMLEDTVRRKNYKSWGVTPKCLFSRDDTYCQHAVGVVVWSL